MVIKFNNTLNVNQVGEIINSLFDNPVEDIVAVFALDYSLEIFLLINEIQRHQEELAKPIMAL